MTHISRRALLGRGMGVTAGAVGAGLLGSGLLGSAARAAVAPAVQAAASVAASASGLDAYQRRIVDIARAQLARNADVVWRRDVVGVADFSRPSADPRLFLVHMEDGRVDSFLVAHGRGSDPEHDGWLKSFSNAVGSNATSRGAYATTAWYEGKYGTSIRLRGLDPDNSHAFDRAIVMHPAWYAASDMLPKYGKLGRSEGCFAMDPAAFGQALWFLAGGRLLFADRIAQA